MYERAHHPFDDCTLSFLFHRHYAFDFCFQELFCSVQLSYEYRKI